MKKIFSILFSALLVLGISVSARAENGATSYSGKEFTEQQVSVQMFNNSGDEVSSGTVVILDLSGTGVTAGTTLGSYFTTTTSADSPYIVGVAAETIADQAVGKICVRGPIRVSTSASVTAGANVSTTTTAGLAATSTTTTTAAGTLGTALTTSSGNRCYVWVNPHNQ